MTIQGNKAYIILKEDDMPNKEQWGDVNNIDVLESESDQEHSVVQLSEEYNNFKDNYRVKKDQIRRYRLNGED